MTAQEWRAAYLERLRKGEDRRGQPRASDAVPTGGAPFLQDWRVFAHWLIGKGSVMRGYWIRVGATMVVNMRHVTHISRSTREIPPTNQAATFGTRPLGQGVSGGGASTVINDVIMHFDTTGRDGQSHHLPIQNEDATYIERWIDSLAVLPPPEPAWLTCGDTHLNMSTVTRIQFAEGPITAGSGLVAGGTVATFGPLPTGDKGIIVSPIVPGGAMINAAAVYFSGNIDPSRAVALDKQESQTLATWVAHYLPGASSAASE